MRICNCAITHLRNTITHLHYYAITQLRNLRNYAFMHLRNPWVFFYVYTTKPNEKYMTVTYISLYRWWLQTNTCAYIDTFNQIWIKLEYKDIDNTNPFKLLPVYLIA